MKWLGGRHERSLIWILLRVFVERSWKRISASLGLYPCCGEQGSKKPGVSAWRLSWLDGTERRRRRTEEERREQLWIPDRRAGAFNCALTGDWIRDSCVRGRQKHQRRIIIKGQRRREPVYDTRRRPSSFLIFSVHPSIRCVFFSFFFLASSVSFDFFFFSFPLFDSNQTENEPEWLWIKSQILSLFSFHAIPPLTALVWIAPPICFWYRQWKRKKKGRKYHWAFPSCRLPFHSFISSNVPSALLECVDLETHRPSLKEDQKKN